VKLVARFVGPQGKGAMRLLKAEKRKDAEMRNAEYQQNLKSVELPDGDND
jgi:hypothetical protein